MANVIYSKIIVAGHARVNLLASGRLLSSCEPLSFWGGYDQFSGEIIDRRHPLSGQVAKACILALPASRGSSTTTAVLLEAARNGSAPAAILMLGIDTFFTLASIVSDELYGKPIPIAALEASSFNQLLTGTTVRLYSNGEIHLL